MAEVVRWEALFLNTQGEWKYRLQLRADGKVGKKIWLMEVFIIFFV
jgi:hypothetical protein